MYTPPEEQPHYNSSRSRAMRLVDEIPDLDLRRAAVSSLGMAPDIVPCVKVFHRLYELPILTPKDAREDFSHITRERLAMRFRLIEEEYKELCDAMDIQAIISYRYMDEEGDWITAMDLQDAIENTENRDIAEVADACEDLKYVITGFELEVGIDPHAVLGEVQASNMSKLNADGTVLKREDGKVLKGENYFKADPYAALKAFGLRIGPAATLSTKAAE